ncbi:MAG: RNA polymerase sigma factor, partial [Clostridiales bacterium]|nr:RNA polymerase sigma factor [Clostridiales bacterium]
MERGAELYNKYLRGDNEALEQLVIGYGDGLIGYAYCFLHDFAAAEDVMEDTFATLIVKRKRFISRSPFEAYLFRIARNKCLDRLRKAKRETRLNDCIDYSDYSSVEDDALKVVRDEKVYKAMLTLPQDYRNVLYLTYYQGFSVDEIVSALGKNKKQVYNLLSRAKAALKQLLIKEGIG